MAKTKISEVGLTVKSILLADEKSRDDDNLLVLKVWGEANPNLRNPNFSFIEFSKGLLNNKYPNFDTITRARRKIQEEFPNTRGKNYAARHKNTTNVKDDLKHPELKQGGTP